MKPADCLSSHSQVLIVTRDDSLRHDLEEKLKDIKSFDSIEILCDCLEGIAFARQNNPDVIIFDTEISVLEVLNALRAIKSLPQGIHCVVIADHIGYHGLLSMVGADKILYKGFSQAELVASLN